MSRTLLALLAPGSVEAEVGRLQQRIFKDHGLVSSVALPPLLPVAFLPDNGPRRGFLAGLNAAVTAPYCMTLAGLAWHDGWLYLGVDSGGVWTSLRAAALSPAHAVGGAEAAGFFPEREGFFLGCIEADARQRELIQPHLPEGRFTSAALALMRIDVAEGGAWWREVLMETLEEIPLRGKRR
ncbi:MAG: hypothetical protein ACLQCB_01945 [Spirochaetia bacterium]